MKELAKQELMNLEAQYPTKFQRLKLQLKEFIHLLDQQDQQQQSFKQQQQFHLSVLTQESSSIKRKREWEKVDVYSKTRRSRKEEEGTSGAMQKAEACLQKIQTFKSFFGSLNDH